MGGGPKRANKSSASSWMPTQLDRGRDGPSNKGEGSYHGRHHPCPYHVRFHLAEEDFSMADYCIRAAKHVCAEVLRSETRYADHDNDRVQANTSVAQGQFYSAMLKVRVGRLGGMGERPSCNTPGHPRKEAYP